VHRDRDERDAADQAGPERQPGSVRQPGLVRQQEELERQLGPERQQGLAEQIDELDARIKRLGEYLDAHGDEFDVDDLCQLLDLYSTMMTRVTRMRQAQSHLTAEVKGVLMEAFHWALDELSRQKGIPL
jgi:hypothetical protein